MKLKAANTWKLKDSSCWTFAFVAQPVVPCLALEPVQSFYSQELERSLEPFVLLHWACASKKRNQKNKDKKNKLLNFAKWIGIDPLFLLSFGFFFCRRPLKSCSL